MHIWTLPVDALDEAAVAPWLALLDDAERRRAARFAFSRHRVLFVAAHALLRAALASLTGCRAERLRFVADSRGKPAAYIESQPAPVSFNLSHTAGLAGVAALAGAGCAVGFDLEPLARRVNLAVADRFFAPPEIAWLKSLAAPERAAGFLRLWTLKEAFIKATGKGLTQNLAAFWFDPLQPAIHFAPQLTERPDGWWFEQRILGKRFVAAAGLRRDAGMSVETRWIEVDPAEVAGGRVPMSAR